ncbi:hypothetical protein SJAV_07260 [Sulfurisphaera javensis]|uniref:Uncharacterized protein n=1 Tax=Sulfurisphaera javensis TaxID=2049879 RepID=A0AAT9GPM9_9CREN
MKNLLKKDCKNYIYQSDFTYLSLSKNYDIGKFLILTVYILCIICPSKPKEKNFYIFKNI